MARYLVSTFTLSMLALPEGADDIKEYLLAISGLTMDEFCEEVRRGDYVNAIGHQPTADMINTLCGTNIKANRVEVRLDDKGDSELLVVQLTVRPPEGKVYTVEELARLYGQGKVKFLRVLVLPAR